MSKKNRYADMTTEDFDRILAEIVSEEADVLSIPGVYELLSEHFNNEILDRWETEREDAE